MQKHRIIIHGTIFLVFAAVSIMCGCTISAPSIIETTWQINHRYDAQNDLEAEELSFWLHLSDEDGDDDIESIYLIHDGSELYWRLQADSWEQTVIGEELWIGHSGLRMYRDGVFPRGEYRIIVMDRAGERAENTIYVSSDRVSPGEITYPSLTFDGEMIRVSGAEKSSRITLWFYDGGAQLIKPVAVSQSEIPIASVLTRQEQERVAEYSVYLYNNTTGTGIISGTFALEKQ